MDQPYLQDFLVNQTVINPIVIFLTLGAGIMILFLPRRYVFLPFIFIATFIPMQQRILIAGFDFFMIRILILFGFTRIIIRSRFYLLKLNPIDKLMILFCVFRIIMYSILWKTPGAFINRLGTSFDALGVYFFSRFILNDLMQNPRQIIAVIKDLLVLCIPLAIIMLLEYTTARNFFSVFGGVPEVTFVRDGRLRCQGAFQHPILAGTFGASLLPLFLSLCYKKSRYKILGLLGVCSSTLIVITTSSSGPALTYAAALGAFCLWPFRRFMSIICWGAVFMLIILQIAMNAPLWGLLMRAKIFSGSTGFHRYHLFDQFVKRFGEWWFCGVQSTDHWGRQLFDITNQYIRIAVDGGLITLIIFIIIITLCFRNISIVYKRLSKFPSLSIVYWSLGASLFSHTVSFFGVSYYDQIIFFWYFLLALISTVGYLFRRRITFSQTKPAS